MASEYDMLATMRARLQLAQGAYSDCRETQLADTRFFWGNSDNRWQWPADVLSTRGSAQGQTINARPILTMNYLPQHVRQVTNDQRQNRPGIKVIPVDDGADLKMAEIFEGMIRHIEYTSDADVAYDTASDNQVIHGEGYLRLTTDYVSDDSFEQDLRIMRVRNPFSVFLDPTIQDPCGSDAEWAFITEDLLKDDYERQFPDAMPVSSLLTSVGDQGIGSWLNDKTVRIAEYFHCEYKPAKLLLYQDGTTIFADDRRVKLLKMAGFEPVKDRTVQKRSIKWCKTNGFETLEESDWLGQWIPIVRVIGNEWEVDGQIYVSGLVRNAKDAQRMINYWTSQEAEMLALAPKAPFIGYGGQFEGYEDKWKTANVQNWPYLEVNPDVGDAQGNPLPMPQRAQPPMQQTGLLQAKLGAIDALKGVTGQYDASLGQRSNETSGKAIVARQQESDTGTYHYVDNLARGIRHLGRMIVDLVPKIYDTERVARVVSMDGETEMAKINPAQPQAVNEIRDMGTDAVIERIFNPSVGRYDVMVTTGPSYLTKRQEAASSMALILQGNQQLWPVFGDLAVSSMDWHQAQDIAERIKRWIGQVNPSVLGDEGDESPELVAMKQQVQVLQEHLQQAVGMLENVQNSQEAQDAAVKQFEAQIKAYDAETKRISAVQAGLSEEQIQEIVRGTIDAAIAAGDLIGGPPQPPQTQPMQPQMQPME